MPDTKQNRTSDRPLRGLWWWTLATVLACCMVVAVYDQSMRVVSRIFQRTLEDVPAAVKTPNPSRTPPYWLAHQELLVNWNPYLAGVVLPSAILFADVAGPTAMVLLAWRWGFRKRQGTRTRLTTADLLLVTAASFTLAAIVLMVLRLLVCP